MSDDKTLLIQRIMNGSIDKSKDLIGADLREADLRRADLSGANLSGADLFRANFLNTNLSEADLSGAKLFRADLSGANLSGANLREADLFRADLSGAHLSGAHLFRAKLMESSLLEAILREADLREARLGGAELFRADLFRADLSGADLSKAHLSQADLSGADLSKANLSRVNLSGADLSGKNLSKVNLNEAILMGTILSQADLSEAILSRADLSFANLIGANLIGANLREAELIGAKLIGTRLIDAELIGAKLIEANISGADLSGVNFTRTQVLGADFTGAILTGICIEDWNINSETKLDGAICEYVYLKQNEQERRPHSGTFAPGDFAKLVQSSLETIDLIFRTGLDWKAFAYAFKQIEVQYEDAQLAVQSIENKGDGVVIVKIATSPTADKGEIHGSFMNGYEFASKALAAQYEARLEDKDKHINSLLLIVENLSGVTKAMAESKSGDIFNITAPGSQFASIGAKAESGGNIDITQNVYQGERQSLAEAAAEIQRLLKQLEETNPTATESEQISYVNADIKPSLRKAVAAGKAGLETAIDEFVLENKFLKVIKSVVKGWLEEGS